MAAMGIFALSLLCLLAYISTASAECKWYSRGKMDTCVATFSTANLGNRGDRTDRIGKSNTTCPTDLLKDSCDSFNVMMKCVNILDFPDGCQDEFNKELRNQDFQCTYMELGALCPDAEKLQLGGAANMVVSLSLIVVSLLAAIFYKF